MYLILNCLLGFTATLKTVPYVSETLSGIIICTCQVIRKRDWFSFSIRRVKVTKRSAEASQILATTQLGTVMTKHVQLEKQEAFPGIIYILCIFFGL